MFFLLFQKDTESKVCWIILTFLHHTNRTCKALENQLPSFAFDSFKCDCVSAGNL